MQLGQLGRQRAAAVRRRHAAGPDVHNRAERGSVANEKGVSLCEGVVYLQETVSTYALQVQRTRDRRPCVGERWTSAVMGKSVSCPARR